MNRTEIEQLADRLLLLIRTRPGHRFSLDFIAGDLAVDRAHLPLAAGQLEQWGYTLSLTETDVRLLGTPDSLTATELSWGLDTRLIGRRLLAFNQVKSTNDIAFREGESGAKEGTVVVAEQQIAGRGRLGRTWHSPAGAGSYLSILLRPKFLPENAPGLSLMTALALAQTLEHYCPGQVTIKWPNDLMISDRKVSGILPELAADRERINYVVVGVGININQETHDFPPDLADFATSVRIASGRETNRIQLIQRFFREFEQEYLLYQQDFLGPALPRIRRYSSLLGQPIRLDTGQGIIDGVAVDLDTNGCLVVEHDGRRTSYSSGDASVVKTR